MRALVLVVALGACSDGQVVVEAPRPTRTIEGTLVEWDRARLWVALAERDDAVQVVAGPSPNALRDVPSARFAGIHTVVRDAFRVVPVGEHVLVVREREAREALLLRADGRSARVIRRWRGGQNETAPFEPPE